MFYTLLIRCFTPFSFRVLHPVCSVFYTFSEKRPSTLNVKHHRFEQQLQSVLAQRHGLGELLLAIVGSPPKSGRYARDDAASSLLGRALPRRGGPTLPRRDDVPLSLRNVSARESLAGSSGGCGRFWRNVLAWERCGCARSRLGRSGKKGWPVYLWERQRPSPPKRAISSQGGTLWRGRADFELQRLRFSQAGTMRRECRAKSLLGRALCQPARSPLPRQDDAREMMTYRPCLGEPPPDTKAKSSQGGPMHQGCCVTSRLGRALSDSNEKTPASGPACRGFGFELCGLRSGLRYSAMKSRWMEESTLTPGPIVEETTTDLMYLPLAEAGFTRRISV